MSLIQNRHFDSPLEALDSVRAVIANDTEATDLVRLRAVLRLNRDGKMASFASVFDIVQVESAEAEDMSNMKIDYGYAMLVQRTFKIGELVTRFEEICKSGLKIDGIDGPLAGVPARAELQFHQTDLFERNVPYLEIRLQENGQKMWSNENGPFVNPVSPYLSDFSHAVSAWCHYSKFDSWSDGRAGLVIFRLAQRKHRIDGVKVVADGKKVLVTLDVPDYEIGRLRLKGVWGIPSGRLQINSDVDLSVTLEIPDEAFSIELVLIDLHGQILDYLIESKQAGFIREGIFHQLRYVKGSQDDLDKALTTGECSTVEFKPFMLVSGRGKRAELAETVVAFLNTEGGAIFIGIDDHCQLAGCQEQLRKDYKDFISDIAALKEKYVGDLRQYFGVAIGRPVLLDYMWLSYKEDVVLQISVPKGEKTPYWVSEDLRKDIYIRHGSSNVKPHPDTELPGLMGPGGADGPFGFLAS